MIKDFLQIQTLSLVFLGEFNPVIIQPFWLSSKKLIREQEAQTAKIELIHNELVRYELDWVFVEISKNRFVLKTSKEPYFEPLKDLGLSIFEILKETPIKALGINHIFHYALTNEKTYYEFGNKLAPLSNWNSFLNDPRMLQLEILEEKRKDGLEGYYRVRIQPSDQKLNTKYGLSININDHFSLKSGETGRNKELLNSLKNNWIASSKRAIEVTEELWKKLITK